MWQPEPGWHPLPGGSGASTVGAWRAVRGDQPVVVKRLAAPVDDDPPELSDPHHFAYWRRDADVAGALVVDRAPGLRPPAVCDVEEDPDGITLVREWVEDAAVNGLFAAHAMGRFAGADLPDLPWLARDQLRDLLRRTCTAASQTADLLAGLRVHPARMAATLEAAGSDVRAEQRSMAALTGRDPRPTYLGATDALVDAVLHRAREVTP